MLKRTINEEVSLVSDWHFKNSVGLSVICKENINRVGICKDI